MWSEMVEGKLRVPEVHTYLLDWSSQVQLIEASHVKTTCGSEFPKRFRYFVFADFQGVKVTALAIDANITRFDGVLIPFKKYCISKALVHQIPGHCGIGSYRFYWILTEGTVIEEVAEAGPPKLPYYFGLRSSKNFHFVANTETFINVIGVVVCVFPPKEVFFSGGPSVARDYVIVDYDARPIVLTLWNEFESIEGSAIAADIEQNPVIIGIRLKVTTDNYLSLTTQSSSVILVSPDVHEASKLRAWYHDNASHLARMINAGSYLNASVLLPPVGDNRVSEISTISHATKFDLGIAWIKGRVCLDHRMGRLWYLACPNCYLPNDFSMNWGIMCRYCSREVYPFPRACVTLMIKDESGTLTILAMGEEAEKLTGLSAFRLQQAEQEDVNLTDHVESELAGRLVLCCVRHSDDVIMASRSVKYTLVTSYDVSSAESAAN